MTRTLGRMAVLSAVAVLCFTVGPARAAGAPAPATADEESSLGRILEFQAKLNERIDYELLVPTTLDKALDELLLANRHIPWSINRAAFTAAQQDRDVIKKTEIEKIAKMTGVTRATVLKRLLATIPNDGHKGAPTYVLRRDGVEITTEWAKVREAQGVRAEPDDDAPVLPLPLAYAAFKDVPLQDALKELARTTESTVLLDGRCAEQGKTKVTAELAGVPLDAAVQLLADMADLKLVRVANVYYVTSKKNAGLLQKEEDKRNLETAQMRAISAWTQLAKAWLPEPLQIGLSGPGPLNGRR